MTRPDLAAGQPPLRSRIKAFLLRQTDNPRRNLNWVISGAVLFFLGLGLVFYAEKQLPSSLAQELTALVGLACLSIGAILAGCGYISLSLLRIFRFINDESDPKRSPPRH